MVLNDRGAAIKNNEGLNEMGINGIGTAGYPLTGYTARKMERSAEPGTVGFMETVEDFDILGNTVESAIQATKKALYDLEHPVVYTPRSIEVQQARIKEGEFYRAFLEKLEQL